MSIPKVYLLDTNIASIAWNESHPGFVSIKQKLSNLTPAHLVISCITKAEIEFGLRSVTNINTAKQQLVRNNMNSYIPVEVDRHTAEQYGQIRANLFKQYWLPYHKDKTKYIEDLIDNVTGKSLGIQENDLWIVSLAVQYNMIFVTGDKASGMKRIVEAASYQDRTEYWAMN